MIGETSSGTSLRPAEWRQRLSSLPGSAIRRLEDERTCWIVLGLAVAAYIALALWLTRGTTFYVDEVNFFESSHGWEPKELLAPVNGHLLAVPRAIYAASFRLFGASYVPLRVIEAAGVALVAVLFFALAKPRIGGAAALAPTLVLLFFGTSWEITLSPLGIPNVYSLAAGLGALLALERGGRHGDLGACVLLLVAAGSYSVGLAFVAAAAVFVLLQPDRWRRVWVFLIPLALYGAWWLAKPSLETPLSGLKLGVQLSNLPQVPEFVANSAAAVAVAVTGLNYDSSANTSFVPGNADPIWGPILAAIAAIALVARLRRGRVPPSLSAGIVLLLTLWTSFALVAFTFGRTPEQARYMYPGAVAALIVAVEATRGIRLSRRAVLALFGVAAVSLAFNIAHFFQGGAWLRSYSPSARAQFTAVELAHDSVDPAFVPSGGVSFLLGVEAGPYLAAVDRIGSPAFTPAELQGQSETVRQSADSTLAAALGVNLAPIAAGVKGHDCSRVGVASNAAEVSFSVHPPGALLRSPIAGEVAVGRFATGAPVPTGSLAAHQRAVLSIPADRFSGPWHATVTPAQSPVTVCALDDAP